MKERLVTELSRRIFTWYIQRFGGYQLNLVPATVSGQSADVPWSFGPLKNGSSPARGTLDDVLGIDLSRLYGVPVHLRTRRVLNTRRMSPFYLIQPKKNLIACEKCGMWHEMHKICGRCYSKIRELTERIKAEMHKKYQPFFDPELTPDKEVSVVFKGESTNSPHFEGKRIVELEEERPSWFPNNLSRDLVTKIKK